MPKDLLYTIAFDPPGGTIIRSQAKLFALSVLRTGFAGKFVIFSNHEIPLFPAGRANIEEMRIGTGEMTGRELAEYACAFKYRARDFLKRPEAYRRILFTDCDCLALRNLAPLFEYKEDIVAAVEPGTSATTQWYRGYFTKDEMAGGIGPGINAGTWSVTGKQFMAMTEKMLDVVAAGPLEHDILWGDQPAWNKLVYYGGFSHRGFDSLDLRFPFVHHSFFNDYTQAALVHFCGTNVTNKTRLQFGLFMGHFFGEAAPILADLIGM